MRSRVLFLTLALVLAVSAVQISAKDTWITVRSKNFHLIGNASEKEIRQVATRLEQFRETFRQIFPRLKQTQSINTNVIVFRDDAAYRPFKPKTAGGKPIDGIAGYFQPGRDVNYITLAIGREMNDTYGIIFHEYVHFLLEANFGKSDVPPWFNEGLAEYYQTFKIENDQKVTLGIFQESHLELLQQFQLIPLKQFFEIDYFAMQQGGNHSRSVFYAQSWALMHYLIQGKGGNPGALGTFLDLVLKGADTEKAFQQVFLMDYPAMEKALREYVRQSRYQMSILTFKEKLTFDTQMTVTPLGEAEANAYLGDLLYHTNVLADAEVYLQKALAADPGSSFANTSLGLVRMRQRKFDEAKSYLEKAIAGNAANPLAHFNYAYVISRESMDEFGYVREYPEASFARMRRSLLKAIELDPGFAESYHLLSFILLVNDDSLDEAIAHVRRANDLNPGNGQGQLLLAQLLMKQKKFDDAKAAAEKLMKSADEPDLRVKAENLLKNIREYEERTAQFEKEDQEREAAGIRKPNFVRRNGEKPLTEADIERINRENENLNLNNALKRPAEGQAEAVGWVERVACGRGEVTYTFRTEKETFQLTSKDFSNLDLNAMTPSAEGVSFGCDADVKAMKSVAVYALSRAAGARSRGTLVSLTFVPDHFVRKSEEEMKAARMTVILEDPVEDPKRSEDLEIRRREAMLESIRRNLRQPATGETRVFGVIDRVECQNNGMIFVVVTGEVTLRLRAKSPTIRSYSSEASGLTFGCGTKLPPINAFVIFKGGLLDAGDIVSVEFVPPSFKLDD